jgi:hypothetical protein
MKQSVPALCPDDPLSLLIESAQSETPKAARRYLKNARHAIKRELRRIKKHPKRYPHSARISEAWNDAGSRRVQVVNARPGTLTTGTLPPSGFHFSPPDPGIVHQLLMPDVQSEASSGTEPPEDASASPAPDAMDGDDVLILAAKPRTIRESSPIAPTE